MIRFSCPNCGARLSARENRAGSTAACPRCGIAATVPESLEPMPLIDVGSGRRRAGLPVWGWVTLGIAVLGLVVATAWITARAARNSHSAMPSATEGDVARIQGRWKVTSIVIDGIRQEDNLPPEMKDWLNRSFISFDGDRMKTIYPSKSDRATFSLNPTAHPKEITVTWDHDHVDGRVDLGIYELTDDTLRFCLAKAKLKPRPRSFDEALRQHDVTVLTLRRAP